MFKLPLFQSKANAKRPPQPFSPQSLEKEPRIAGATRTVSVCPYCAVGCSLHVYTKGGRIVDIEGNPESPINQGTLCPKGANSFQLAVNAHRVKQVMWRAPYSDKWEFKSLDWALDRIAKLVKQTRDDDFKTVSPQGRLLNHVTTMGSLGGATLDNEENYLMKKLFGAGLGMVSIENQARI